MFYILIGVIVEPRNMINHHLRLNNYGGAKKEFWRFQIILIVMMVSISIPVYLYTGPVFEKLGTSKEIIDWINKSSILLGLDCVAEGLQFWPRAMMISLDLKNHLLIQNLISGVFLRLFLTWYFVVSLGIGLPGIYIADIISIVFTYAVSLAIIVKVGDSKYKGVLENKIE